MQCEPPKPSTSSSNYPPPPTNKQIKINKWYRDSKMLCDSYVNKTFGINLVFRNKDQQKKPIGSSSPCATLWDWLRFVIYNPQRCSFIWIKNTIYETIKWSFTTTNYFMAYPSFFDESKQYPVDHKTLSTCCHVDLSSVQTSLVPQAHYKVNLNRLQLLNLSNNLNIKSERSSSSSGKRPSVYTFTNHMSQLWFFIN